MVTRPLKVTPGICGKPTSHCETGANQSPVRAPRHETWRWISAARDPLIEHDQEGSQRPVGNERVSWLLTDSKPTHRHVRQAGKQVHANVARLVKIVAESVGVEQVIRPLSSPWFPEPTSNTFGHVFVA